MLGCVDSKTTVLEGLLNKLSFSLSNKEAQSLLNKINGKLLSLADIKCLQVKHLEIIVRLAKKSQQLKESIASTFYLLTTNFDLQYEHMLVIQFFNRHIICMHRKQLSDALSVNPIDEQAANQSFEAIRIYAITTATLQLVADDFFHLYHEILDVLSRKNLLLVLQLFYNMLMAVWLISCKRSF